MAGNNENNIKEITSVESFDESNIISNFEEMCIRDRCMGPLHQVSSTDLKEVGIGDVWE